MIFHLPKMDSRSSGRVAKRIGTLLQQAIEPRSDCEPPSNRRQNRLLEPWPAISADIGKTAAGSALPLDYRKIESNHTVNVAERGGFEPPRVLSLPVFETGAFSRSATSPRRTRAVLFRPPSSTLPIFEDSATLRQSRSDRHSLSNADQINGRYPRGLYCLDFGGRSNCYSHQGNARIRDPGFDLKLIP
jgi:hypothetical protein